jgi:uncharacterized membrane protein
LADITASKSRIAAVDVARGVAIVSMVAYHATLDLGPQFYGLIAVDALNDPVLRWVARLTAGTFLFLVGVSLVLAHRNGFRLNRFLRRLAILIAAAAAVTIATYFFVPYGFVRFGILHAIAAVSVIGVLFLRAPLWLVGIGAVAAFAAPAFLRAPFFDAPFWVWLGLSTPFGIPPMFDYVPVLPWLGPTLLGILATRIALAMRLDERWSGWEPRGFIPRALQWAGRWSLVIYLTHQLILLAPYFAMEMLR